MKTATENDNHSMQETEGSKSDNVCILNVLAVLSACCPLEPHIFYLQIMNFSLTRNL
jgi:hypothetical protein